MAEITSVGETAERFEDGRRKGSQNASSSVQDGGVKRGPEDTCISIQTEDVANWVSKFNKRCLVEPTSLKVSSTSISCSIHRVPPNIRKQNEKAYDPEIISIGPFHYEKRSNKLQAMEEHKWRYLRDIISRKGEGSLQRYFLAVKELEERARNCYSEVIKLNSYSFVEMMVLDGCFIIEFLRKYWEEDYEDDPIFKLQWLNFSLNTDLLMLENQIPFFILQRLFHLTYCCSSRSHSLVGQIITFFDSSVGLMGKGYMPEGFNMEIQHVLHLFHTTRTTFTKEKHSAGDFLTIPSASKLKEGGIEFKKRDASAIMLDIGFQKEKGVIEIPHIKVFDNSNFVFLNLIAFEQCYLHCKKYFTAYASVMDNLINTDKDIEILSKNGIIENCLASDQDVANLFNSMARDISIYRGDFYLSDVCNEINEYYKRPWPKLRATLVHDYFKNPCTTIAFLAALLLLLLTMTQTFFSSFPKFAYGK